MTLACTLASLDHVQVIKERGEGGYCLQNEYFKSQNGINCLILSILYILKMINKFVKVLTVDFMNHNKLRFGAETKPKTKKTIFLINFNKIIFL